jgi:5-methyltetrahydrofolate--homocysteine methyltransferase
MTSATIDTGTSTLYQAVISGNAKLAENAAAEALAAGTAPHVLVAEHLIPAMQNIDARFQCKDCAEPELCYVPEQLLVNRAIQAALRAITPALEQSAPSNDLRVVIATVEGDRCDLGRDLVAPLLRGIAGQVIDLGVGVSNQELIRVAAEKPGTILVLYTRKTSSLAKMKSLKDELEKTAPHSNTKILVVGHRINSEDCRKIGADGFTGDALGTISSVSSLAGLD